MKKAILLLLILLLASLAFLPTAAAPDHVIDDGGFFTDAQKAELESAFANASGDTEFYLITRENLSTYLSNSEAHRAAGLSGDPSAIVLLVYRTGSEWHYDIYTFGESQKALTNGDIDKILDAPEVYNNLKSGRIAEGANAFLTVCQKTMAKRARSRRVTPIVCALIFGSVAGGGSVLGVVIAYRRKRHGESYPLDRYARLNLTDCRDIFVGSHVTRVRIQSNTTGGSHGGGGGGGISFSGGHRGGR